MKVNHFNIKPVKILLILIVLSNISRVIYSADLNKKPVIRKITIVIKEIFSKTKSPIKQFINKMHISTRESVIKKQLLYKEGDILDKDIIEESERNLRKFRIFFVEETKIIKVKNQNKVDIIVEVQDVWSIYFDIKADAAGGVFTYNFKLGDRNFLGRNNSLEVNLERNSFLNIWRQMFYEPMVFGSRFTFFGGFNLSYMHDGKKVGEGLDFRLIYPFFSRKSEWGFIFETKYSDNFTYDNIGSQFKQYEVVVGSITNSFPKRYNKEFYSTTIGIIRSYGYKIKNYYAFKFKHEYKNHSLYDDIPAEFRDDFVRYVLPENSDRKLFLLGFSMNNYKYIKKRSVYNKKRIIDYALGLYISGFMGISKKWWDSYQDFYYLEMEASYSFSFLDDHIFKIGSAFSSDLFFPGLRNAELSFYFWYIIRNLPIGQIYIKAEATLGQDLEIDKKYELGGGNGLRGYQTNKFEGDRRIFFNAEYHFARINIDMLRIGFVIFFDLGSAWYNKDRSIMDASFYPSVGIGFRFSLPELFPNMLSFDIGYNFGNDSSEFGKIISIRMEVPIF